MCQKNCYGGPAQRGLQRGPENDPLSSLSKRQAEWPERLGRSWRDHSCSGQSASVERAAHVGPPCKASERVNDRGKGSGGAGKRNHIQKTVLHIKGRLSTRSPGKDLQFLKRNQGLPPWQAGCRGSAGLLLLLA